MPAPRCSRRHAPQPPSKFPCDAGKVPRNSRHRRQCYGTMVVASCGCGSMVELKPSKLSTRVRFPSPAPSEWQRAKALFALAFLFAATPFRTDGPAPPAARTFARSATRTPAALRRPCPPRHTDGPAPDSPHLTRRPSLFRPPFPYPDQKTHYFFAKCNL